MEYETLNEYMLDGYKVVIQREILTESEQTAKRQRTARQLKQAILGNRQKADAGADTLR